MNFSSERGINDAVDEAEKGNLGRSEVTSCIFMRGECKTVIKTQQEMHRTA